MIHRPLITFALLSLLGLTGVTQAATQVSLSPVRLTIDVTAERATVLTVKNLDQQAVDFTAEVFRWSQKNGEDVLEPTRDVLLNPPRLHLPAGGTQLVRIALRTPSRSVQDTYRVILRQLPAAPPPASAGSNTTSATLTTLFQFSLPLFVGTDAAKASTRLSLQRTQDGLILNALNSGNGYALYRNLSLKGSGKTTSLGNLYVLAGAQMHLNVPDGRDLSGTLELSYEDADQQQHHETLSIPH